MAQVFIPAELRPLVGGQSTVDVEGGNVRQVIANLDSRFPGVAKRLCSGDALRSGLTVAVGGSVGSLGLLEPVAPDAEVHFLPAIGGGC